MPLNIAIVGGGIAGCAAALALQKRGFNCIVYEQRAELKDEGYGIQLSPNALRCLDWLGVKVEGFHPQSLVVNARVQMNMAGFITLKRETLHKALQAGVVNLHLNTHIEKIDADVVIAADGINSSFRQDALIDSGLSAWRKVINGSLQNVEMQLFSGWHNVQYAVSQQEINQVYIRKNGIVVEGFTPYTLFTRPFMGGTGHMTLIGDAAHAMLPSLAQGAAMALEDAVVLGQVFDPLNIGASLRAFEAARKPRVTRVAKAALMNSYIYKLPKPLSYARDIVLKSLSQQQFRNKYAWIYDDKL